MTQHTPTPWLVYSREHNLWWRPNASGYTHHMSEAGRYSQADATKHCLSRSRGDDGPPEFMVPAPETLDHHDELVAALKELSFAEAHYRQMHDYYGKGALVTGQAWRRLKLAGDNARAILDKVKQS